MALTKQYLPCNFFLLVSIMLLFFRVSYFGSKAQIQSFSPSFSVHYLPWLYIHPHSFSYEFYKINLQTQLPSKLFILFFLFFFLFKILGPRLQYMEVPRLWSNWSCNSQPTLQKQQLQVQAAPVRYTTAHGNPGLNPLNEARDLTHVLMDTSRVRYP